MQISKRTERKVQIWHLLCLYVYVYIVIFDVAMWHILCQMQTPEEEVWKNRASALVHRSISIISLERRIIKIILCDCNSIIIIVCVLVYKMSWYIVKDTWKHELYVYLY